MRRLLMLAGAAALLSGVAFGQTCDKISLGVNGNLNGFKPFPSTDAWNTPIVANAVDAATTDAFNSLFGPAHLHPDFGQTYGIPYNVVDTSTFKTVPITMNVYPGDSDIMPWPLDSSIQVEGAPGECPDQSWDYHALVVDRKTCFVYETWQTSHCETKWSASNGAIWDLTASEKRPYGMTSADAAGLSVFAGLLKYEEAAAGQINHAIRFTVSQTKNNRNGGLFVAPATHAAGVTWGSPAIIGARLRLKPGVDISGYSPINKAILTAMKTYGLLLADNGGTGFFQGTNDARWDDNDLRALGKIQMQDFEVVSTGATAWDNTTAPTGQAPTIRSLTASQTAVAAGTPIVLSYEVVNDSYDFIDVVGPVRGPVTVTPAETTTYTLVSSNAFGRSTREVTVTVLPAGTSPSTPVTPPPVVTVPPAPIIPPPPPVTTEPPPVTTTPVTVTLPDNASTTQIIVKLVITMI